MSILYLVTAPPPVIEGTDAVLQDVDALRDAFRGEMVNLSPLNTSTRRFPKQLYGLHKIAEIMKLESRCKINHIFFSLPYPFPVLRILRNPVFYTITATLDPQRRPRAPARLARLRRIIVSNERDAGVLASWGLTNRAVIAAGIEASRLLPADMPLERELTLLMASAPWAKRQFDLKGIDLLLAVVAKLPFLRLILLWRGALAEDLTRRITRLGVASRVEVVNRKVNVNDYLGKVHATVLLAKHGGVVKSYPHSMIESLLAGKPVLMSGTIAMSDYVSKNRCGVVVDDLTIPGVSSAIGALMRDYRELRGNALRTEPGDFSIKTMIDNHRILYGL